jgi:hypothetical protein
MPFEPSNSLDVPKVLETVDSLRQIAAQRIEEAKSTMQREVMATAKSLNQIFVSATDHISRLRAVVATTGGGQGDSVHTEVEDQLDAVKSFLVALSDHFVQQKALVNQATKDAEKIAAAGRKVETLTGCARLLSLNARVEAVRATDGQCFAVLADEMKQLSNQISEANVMIQHLAVEMRTALPRIATAVEDTRVLAEGFEKIFQGSSQGIASAVQRQREAAAMALRQGDETLASIVSGSQEALSHLQFQDVVAQGLDRLDVRFRDGQVSVRMALNLADRVSEVAPAIQREIGGEKTIDHSRAGEVLLF